MYLRVHHDGTITLSAPKRLPDKVIQDFINSKSDWILAQRERMLSGQGARHKQEFIYTTGEMHYLWGQAYTLVVEEIYGRSSVSVESNETIQHRPNHLLMRSYDTTKEEHIALIKEWIPVDDGLEDCDIDLFGFILKTTLLKL